MNPELEAAATRAAWISIQLSDRHDQAGLLGKRNNVVRTDAAQQWMVPAQQQFPAHALAVAADQELAPDRELIAGERLPQFRLEPGAMPARVVHAPGEQSRAASALCLGPVQRDVGAAHQFR